MSVHTCITLNTRFSAEEPISDEFSGCCPHSSSHSTALGVCHTLWPAVWKMTSVPPSRQSELSATPATPGLSPHTAATCQPHHSHPSLPYAALAQRPPHRASLGWARCLGHLAAEPAPEAALRWVMRSDRALQAPWVPQLCPFNWMWHQQGTYTCATVFGLRNNHFKIIAVAEGSWPPRVTYHVPFEGEAGNTSPSAPLPPASPSVNTTVQPWFAFSIPLNEPKDNFCSVLY